MKAYELLSDRSKWTQSCEARDVNGEAVSYSADTAVCWCLMGACCKCYSTEDEMGTIFEKLYNVVKVRLVTWNDATGRTYQEVYDLLKKLDV